MEFMAQEIMRLLRIINSQPVQNRAQWKAMDELAAPLEFTEEDHPGFWESVGYHNHGDPWLEERYQR